MQLKNINNIDEICVDVIMSVYNAEKTISEAIDSMLNQTHHKVRLIICNDASTDGTYSILEKYKQKREQQLWNQEWNKQQREKCVVTTVRRQWRARTVIWRELTRRQ